MDEFELEHKDLTAFISPSLDHTRALADEFDIEISDGEAIIECGTAYGFEEAKAEARRLMNKLPPTNEE